MRRIKTTALTSENEKFYYEGDLFTGIGFEISNGVIEKRLRFLNGNVVGEYNNDLITNSENDIWVDSSFLDAEEDDDEEPFLYNNAYFTGIACEFYGRDYCYKESQYVDGYCDTEVRMFESGDLSYFDSPDGDLYQKFEWHENGSLRNLEISKGNEWLAEAEFTENEELKALKLLGNYFEGVSSCSDQLKFHFFEDIDNLKKQTVAATLYLSGAGIDDKIFSELQQCNGFEKVSEISLFKASVTASSIIDLEKHENLKDLDITDQREEIAAAGKKLKQKRVNLSITLNDEEILL